MAPTCRPLLQYFYKNLRLFWKPSINYCSTGCTGHGSTFSYRSHTCGELKSANVGQSVTLCGWVQHKRLGYFLVLRDSYGTTQIVVPKERPELSKVIESLSLESVIQVRGTVIWRPEGQSNKEMATGDIEISAEDIDILGQCRPQLPFHPQNSQKVNEPLRLQYRYLDLRNSTLQANLRLRSKVVLDMRKFLCEKHGFIDVETPTLFRRTPGGAREFIVPTRRPGRFYSLTQSPQQFKQLLMIGGLDRYFQIARCYRDETTLPNRQPEFTQVDLEMSFVDREGIMQMVEELLLASWPDHLKAPQIPFQKMTYEDAMRDYGSDKPDTRFEMKLQDLSNLDANATSPFHKTGIEPECIKSIVIPQGVTLLTNSEISKLLKVNKIDTKVAVSHIKVKDQREWSHKNVNPAWRNAVNCKLNLNPGDLLVFAVGSEKETCETLGSLRLKFQDAVELQDSSKKRSENLSFLWVINFPMFLENENGKLESAHHPFTAPVAADIPLLYSNPLQAQSLHYDLVLDGNEVGGGSIRIHDSSLQRHILEGILGEDSSELAHLLTALECGCPPHGGIALGLDRLISIMCKSVSIRDVIAFPKSLDGKDLMSGAPASITGSEEKTYYIKVANETTQK